MSVSSTYPPFLVVYSIGNPEPQYENTRHSVGHCIANRLQENLGCSDWLRSSRQNRSYSAASSSIPVQLFKSQTVMNASGPLVARNWQAIKRTKQSEGYEPVLVVINDELSLPVGQTQVRLRNASPRGHNGLKSIRGSIGGNFLSISVGIGRPETRNQTQISNYVLSRIPPDELHIIETESVQQVMDYLEDMLQGRYIYESY